MKHSYMAIALGGTPELARKILNNLLHIERRTDSFTAFFFPSFFTCQHKFSSSQIRVEINFVLRFFLFFSVTALGAPHVRAKKEKQRKKREVEEEDTPKDDGGVHNKNGNLSIGFPQVRFTLCW